MSYNPLELGVYLTDLNLQNIAYNEIDKKVYIIDVENVILVDKKRIREGNFLLYYGFSLHSMSNFMPINERNFDYLYH